MSFYSRIPNNSRPLLWPHNLSQSWSGVPANGHIISIIGSLFSLVVVFSLSLLPSHSGPSHPQSLGQLLRLAFKASPAERPNVSIHADLSSVCTCVFVWMRVTKIDAARTIFTAIPETLIPVCHTKGAWELLLLCCIHKTDLTVLWLLWRAVQICSVIKALSLV